MNTTLDTIVVIALIVAVVLIRSITWREVKLSKLTRMPIVLGLVGVVLLAQVIASLGSTWRPSSVDLGVLGGELVLAVVAGWAMGRLSEFRTLDGVVASRLRLSGVAVFLGFVAVRVGVAAFAGSIGGTPALLSSSVLLVIAVIKLTQGLVVTERYHRHLATVSPATRAHAAPAVVEASYR